MEPWLLWGWGGEGTKKGGGGEGQKEKQGRVSGVEAAGRHEAECHERACLPLPPPPDPPPSLPPRLASPYLMTQTSYPSSIRAASRSRTVPLKKRQSVGPVM